MTPIEEHSMAMTHGQSVEVHKYDQAFLRAFVRMKRLMEE